MLELTRFDGHPSIEMEVFAMGSNRSRRAYPPEFRQQVVELYHAGRSTTELAQDFGPHPQSIRNWVAWAKRDAGAVANGGSLTPSEREELDRLRRENRQLKLDREILSKAAAWFARETNRIPPQGSDS
jgi:transposase